MPRECIDKPETARRAIQKLLQYDVLAFDLETQPLFPYPTAQTKTEYRKYFKFLCANRWGLHCQPTPETLDLKNLPDAVDPQAEIERVTALLEQARGKTKVAQKRVSELETVIDALRKPFVPEWVLRHVAELLKRNEVRNDPLRPGLDPRSSCVFLAQFATPDGEAYCFNVRRLGMNTFLPIFERVGLVGANLTFDVQHIIHTIGVFPRIAWDVIVVDRVMSLGVDVQHNLKDIALRWVGKTLDKEVRTSFMEPYALEPSPEQIAYALDDVEVLFPTMRKQQDAVKRLGMDDAVRLFVSLTVPTAAIEYCGLKIDRERWITLAEETERRLHTASEAFAAYLGIAPEDLTKREVVKAAAKVKGVDVAALNRQELGEVERRYAGDEEKMQFFTLHQQWSHWQKRVTTYGRSFLAHIHPLTGRIHPNLRIAGADTGRYASNNPNILNLPRGEGEDIDYRSAFVAPDNFTFGSADYASMEQRIAADLSCDPALLALFASGGDNHSVTAALMFHTRRGAVKEPQPATFEFQHNQISGYVVPEAWDAGQLVQFVINSGLTDDIGKKYRKTTRQTAKVVAFLYFYGGTPVGLAKKLHCSLEEAERFFKDFKSAYPALSRWFAENGCLPFTNQVRRRDGQRAGYIATYAGLRRWFALPSPAGTREEEKQAYRQRSAIARQAMNFPCQGGNAVVMAQAIVDFWRVGKPRSGEIEARLGIERMVVAPIYDEALVLLPAEIPEKEAQVNIKTVMEAAGSRYMTNCPAVADPNPTSRRWRKF